MVTIIIPVYNEGQNIERLSTAIFSLGIDNLELLFVDDGSTDNTFSEIKRLSGIHPRVKCISFSRNFGHQNALIAGIENASGELIITMDGDGQHPPEMIPEIIAALHRGADIVHTTRTNNREAGWWKNTTSSLFYRILNLLSETKVPPGVSDFRGFTRQVQQTILTFGERDLFLRGLFSWIGFKSVVLPYEASPRWKGSSKYSLRKMTRLGLHGITSFTFRPLRIAFLIGCFVSLVAFAFALFALISYVNGDTVPGWASIIIAIMFLGGTQLLAIGLLGEYVASLFVETKKRPLFIIKERINLSQDFSQIK